MDFLAMRPSEWRSLAKNQLNESFYKEFNSSLENFVQVASRYDSAEDAYVTALQLSAANVWLHFPAAKIAKILVNASQEFASSFLKGIPAIKRAEIANELVRLIASSQERPKAPAKKTEPKTLRSRSYKKRYASSKNRFLSKNKDKNTPSDDSDPHDSNSPQKRVGLNPKES